MLSIIIPIYNVEQYLPRALDSVLSQGLAAGEYEVLLIDDGSTDHSLQVCQEYQQREPSIFRIISKPNEGVSKTRNRGIKEARGELLYFMDADDYLLSQGLSLVLKHWDEDTDILLFYSRTVLPHEIDTMETPNNGEVLFKENAISLLEKWHNTFMWNQIIRKSFIMEHGLSMPEDMKVGEDVYFNLQLCFKNPRIKGTNYNIYRYVVRDGSAITKRNATYLRSLIPGYIKLIDYIYSRYHECLSHKPALSSYIQSILQEQLKTFTSRILQADLTTKEFKRIKALLSKSLPDTPGGYCVSSGFAQSCIMYAP